MKTPMPLEFELVDISTFPTNMPLTLLGQFQHQLYIYIYRSRERERGVCVCVKNKLFLLTQDVSRSTKKLAFLPLYTTHNVCYSYTYIYFLAILAKFWLKFSSNSSFFHPFQHFILDPFS